MATTLSCPQSMEEFCDRFNEIFVNGSSNLEQLSSLLADTVNSFVANTAIVEKQYAARLILLMSTYPSKEECLQIFTPQYIANFYYGCEKEEIRQLYKYYSVADLKKMYTDPKELEIHMTKHILANNGKLEGPEENLTKRLKNANVRRKLRVVKQVNRAKQIAVDMLFYDESSWELVSYLRRESKKPDKGKAKFLLGLCSECITFTGIFSDLAIGKEMVTRWTNLNFSQHSFFRPILKKATIKLR